MIETVPMSPQQPGFRVYVCRGLCSQFLKNYGGFRGVPKYLLIWGFWLVTRFASMVGQQKTRASFTVKHGNAPKTGEILAVNYPLLRVRASAERAADSLAPFANAL